MAGKKSHFGTVPHSDTNIPINHLVENVVNDWISKGEVAVVILSDSATTGQGGVGVYLVGDNKSDKNSRRVLLPMPKVRLKIQKNVVLWVLRAFPEGPENGGIDGDTEGKNGGRKIRDRGEGRKNIAKIIRAACRHLEELKHHFGRTAIRLV